MSAVTADRRHMSRSARDVRVIFPTGMLGGGFPDETIARGIELGADAIAVDGGSTDSGPYYLGTGTAKTTEAVVEHDLLVQLRAAREADIPLIATSCATAGTDAGVDWVAGMVDAIAREENLRFTLSTIFSEQHADAITAALAAGAVNPLPSAGPIDAQVLRSCEHIVGLMGFEPIADALAGGADVVLAGRATDTASVGALALTRGLPPGPTWHAAKTVECGGFCTTNPPSGGGLLENDNAGLTAPPRAPNSPRAPPTRGPTTPPHNAPPPSLRAPPPPPATPPAPAPER